ncbi:MAG TPA: BolA family protein [Legionellaceae bacterium]|nr:BolA family protein [Legionellaceae bacterium]
MNTHSKKRYDYILEMVHQHFSPQFVELTDESFTHQNAEGAESHFKLTLVSTTFKDCNRVQRHQMVNEILLTEFQKGLHALSLSLFTPEEWATQPSVLNTPLCHRKTQKEV